MLTPGYRDPCQLVWQVNQLGSQEEAPQHLRLVCASHGPRALSRAFPAAGLALYLRLAAKLRFLPDELAGDQASTYERNQNLK
jgi:hypothetical protein